MIVLGSKLQYFKVKFSQPNDTGDKKLSLYTEYNSSNQYEFQSAKKKRIIKVKNIINISSLFFENNSANLSTLEFLLNINTAFQFDYCLQ